MPEFQYDTAEAAKAYGGPELVDARYAEVRGAVDRLTNQIASAEVALHDLGVKVSPVARMDDPQPGKAEKSPNSGGGTCGHDRGARRARAGRRQLHPQSHQPHRALSAPANPPANRKRHRMTEPATPQTDAKKDDGTDYVILAKDGATWKQGRTVTARSADQAIRDYLKTAGGTPVNADGTYLAIPARSFKPVTVKTETVTTLKLEEAK